VLPGLASVAMYWKHVTLSVNSLFLHVGGRERPNAARAQSNGLTYASPDTYLVGVSIAMTPGPLTALYSRALYACAVLLHSGDCTYPKHEFII
jgi:hypothetical protein